MTEDQKAMSLILELLHAAKGVPVADTRLAQEVRYCGFRNEISGILRRMVREELIEEMEDGLGIVRYVLTKAGKEAFDAL
jgi:DNA-binding HxlR family transcriptional regulator